MDDIDTRLETERPDVADALKSMNWDERLAEARARRKAVLKNPGKSEKRPVVRIVDAAAMAQRRAGAQARPVETEDAAPAVQVTTPLPDHAPSQAAVHAPEEPEAKTEIAAGTLAGRTALGFGLGLGLGASLVAGIFLLLGMPGLRTASEPETPVEVAAVPTVSAPVGEGTAAPTVSAPAGEVAAVVPPRAAVPSSATSPIVSVEVAARMSPPVLEGAAAAPPAVVSMRPSVAQAPQRPTDIPSEKPFDLTAAPPAPAPSARDLVLGEAPAAMAAPAILPATWPTASPPARPAAVSVALPDIPPAWGAGPSRPARGVAPRTIAANTGNATAPLLPGASAPPLPVALPAGPSALTPLDAAPAVFAAPPAPPLTPETGSDVRIPNGDALFVRIVVPETVSDAEAEDLAGLLRTAGVADGRISRVAFKVNDTHLRFYHAEDAEAAAAVAELAGSEARDFTSFRPSPPEGTIEFFIAGDRTSPPPRAAAAPKRARPQPPDELTRMRDRIVNRLRRGEHL
jgi:hypothetical protein